jgi:hypothetical protein
MAKPLLPPSRTYNSIIALPSKLWLQRAADQRPLDVIIKSMPSFMSSSAISEVMATDLLDPEYGASWWTSLWGFYDEKTNSSPEFLMLSLAMAATYGWPKVCEDLIAIGAPLGLVERPSSGWEFLLNHPALLLNSYSALELAAMAMRGNSAVTPWHPHQEEGLCVLFAAGADPNILSSRAAEEILCSGAIAKLFIEKGLSPFKRSPHSMGEPLFGLLFGSEIELSVPARAKVLRAFIDNGLPIHPPGGSLLRLMAESVYGLRLLPVVLLHSDKDGLRHSLIAEESSLRRRSSRMNKADQAAFLCILTEAILELQTPMPTNHAPKIRL